MMMTVTVVTALLAFVIGGAVRLGMCTFNINVIKRKESGFMDLFSQFHRLGTGFCMNFVLGLFTFLWSLLLVIPGVIAAFSYAMVPYLMAEFPDLRLMDAIRESKRLMRGNKWRLGVAWCADHGNWLFLDQSLSPDGGNCLLYARYRTRWYAELESDRNAGILI